MILILVKLPVRFDGDVIVELVGQDHGRRREGAVEVGEAAGGVGEEDTLETEIELVGRDHAAELGSVLVGLVKGKLARMEEVVRVPVGADVGT